MCWPSWLDKFCLLFIEEISAWLLTWKKWYNHGNKFGKSKVVSLVSTYCSFVKSFRIPPVQCAHVFKSVNYFPVKARTHSATLHAILLAMGKFHCVFIPEIVTHNISHNIAEEESCSIYFCNIACNNIRGGQCCPKYCTKYFTVCPGL